MIAKINLNNFKDINLDEIFPDLPEVLKHEIDTKEQLKQDVISWIENDVKGPQFNAIRICILPQNMADQTQESSYCEYFKLCPLHQNGSAPVGHKCPIEKFEVHQWTQELIDDLEINMFEEATDKHLLGELVVFSLLEQRALRALAASSLDRLVVTYGKHGVTYEKQENFYLNTINQLQQFKRSLRKSLIATREEKIKINKKITNDNTNTKSDEIKDKILKAESVKNSTLGIIINPTEGD